MPNYQAMAASYARQYGVPVQLFQNQIKQESGFNPNAKSGAGALGIAQFMPSTAQSMGVNPMDPRSALDGAARLMSDNYHKYGSWARALSAYNSGRPDAYKDPGFAGGQTYNYVKDIMGKLGKGALASVPAAGKSAVSPPIPGSTAGLGGAQNTLAALMLQQAGLTASGQDAGQSLLAMAAARQQAGAAQAVYGQKSPSTSPTPAPEPAGKFKSSIPFLGDTQGVNSGFLSKVSAAARAAGATQIRVTSGYRSPEHNAAVGGVGHSNHTFGHALDGDAFIPGKGWVPLGIALQPVVGKFGLRSGNVPGFYNGGVDTVHVDDGYNLTH